MKPFTGVAQPLTAAQQLQSIGQLAGAGFLSTGQINYVKDADDLDRKEWRVDVPATNRFTDIQSAITACRAGTNDYVLVCPKSDDTNWLPGAIVTIDSKDGMHLVGVGSGIRKPIIEFAGLAYLITATVKDVEIANLKIIGTGAANTHVFTDGTNCYRTWIHDCRIYSTALAACNYDMTFASEDSVTERCVLGRADERAAGIDGVFDTTSTCKRPTILNSVLLHFAINVGDQHIEVNSGVSAGLPFYIKDTLMINVNLDNFIQAVAVNCPITDGVIMHNCGVIGCAKAVTAGKGLVVPGGMGLTVADADVCNPALAINAGTLGASDT